MANTNESRAKYMRIKAQIKQLEEELKNRCIECYYLKDGVCEKHGQVPEDCIHAKVECPDFDYLPF